MKRICDKCTKKEATCYNGVMNLCDECLLNVYNRTTSENQQCVICGRYGLQQHRTIDGRWICSLACLKKYFGYRPIEET